jgi:serine/threonine protein kinase
LSLIDASEGKLIDCPRLRPICHHERCVHREAQACNISEQDPLITPASGDPVRRQRFGPYELLRLLALGSLWELYEAENARTERRVAVKILRKAYAQDQSLRARIRRNIPVVARLVAPHSVPIYDWGEIDGQLNLEMPLIDGTDLGDLLARDGPLSPARSVSIAGQIASALDTAHAARLVHRQVTPKKILVTRDDVAYLLGSGTAYRDPNADDSASYSTSSRSAWVTGRPIFGPANPGRRYRSRSIR